MPRTEQGWGRQASRQALRLFPKQVHAALPDSWLARVGAFLSDAGMGFLLESLKKSLDRQMSPEAFKKLMGAERHAQARDLFDALALSEPEALRAQWRSGGAHPFALAILMDEPWIAAWGASNGFRLGDDAGRASERLGDFFWKKSSQEMPEGPKSVEALCQRLLASMPCERMSMAGLRALGDQQALLSALPAESAREARGPGKARL